MQNKNRGAAMVEFAIVAPFFFMLMCSIIYGGIVMHDYHRLVEVTRAAARYGAVIDSGVVIVDGKYSETDASIKKQNIKNFVNKELTSGDLLILYAVDGEPKVNVNKEFDSSLNDSGVQVSVTAKIKTDGLPTFLFLDYFPDSMRTITSTITMRRED